MPCALRVCTAWICSKALTIFGGTPCDCGVQLLATASGLVNSKEAHLSVMVVDDQNWTLDNDVRLETIKWHLKGIPYQYIVGHFYEECGTLRDQLSCSIL